MLILAFLLLGFCGGCLVGELLTHRRKSTVRHVTELEAENASMRALVEECTNGPYAAWAYEWLAHHPVDSD